MKINQNIEIVCKLKLVAVVCNKVCKSKVYKFLAVFMINKVMAKEKI